MVEQLEDGIKAGDMVRFTWPRARGYQDMLVHNIGVDEEQLSIPLQFVNRQTGKKHYELTSIEFLRKHGFQIEKISDGRVS